MSSIEKDLLVDSAGQAVSHDNEYLRANGGILLPEQYHFTFGVDKITPKNFGEKVTPDEYGNILTRWTVHMSDGVRLGMNFCEPKNRSTDIAILETPAWFTNLHGFNESTQRLFGSIGIPSILIGHVGQDRSNASKELAGILFKPWKTVKEIRGISLARQAHNMLDIQQYAADSFQLDNKAVFLHGNSRGAMVQFPALAMAKKRGIAVPFAMPVAPCFAEGFSRETLKELRQTPGAESLNVGKLIVRNLFDMSNSGLNTLNVSPKALLYELAHTDSLFNGDAGRFDDLIDPEQNMLILAYRSDFAGMYAKWQTKFSNHPNVYVRDVPGAHSSIADKRTANYRLGIFGNYANQLREGEHVDNLDHSHIRRPLTLVK